MEPCCALKYYPEIEVCQSEKDGDIANKQKELELAEEEDFGTTRLSYFFTPSVSNFWRRDLTFELLSITIIID